MNADYDPDHHARPDDPDTSREAAEQLSTFGRHCRQLLEVFGALADGPHWEGLTFEEAAFAAEIDPWAASKRISDLRHIGLIAWIPINLEGDHTHMTRRGTSNRRQRVYDLTQRGRDVLARLAVNV